MVSIKPFKIISNSTLYLILTRKYRILRKTDGFYEDYYLEKNDIAIMTRSLRIRTHIDYFSNIFLIKESIRVWKNLNPLLRSKIRRMKSGSDKADWFNYFVLDDDKELSNVSFLVLNKSTLMKNHNDIVELLIQKDINSNYDYVHDPLWKLSIYKIENHLYDFIFTINHSIAEDRCMFYLILKLLSIIELMINKNYEQEKEFSVLKPMVGSYVQESSRKALTKTLFKRPNFIESKRTYEDEALPNSTNYKDLKLLNAEDKHVLITVDELSETSQSSSTRFARNMFESREIIAKCKSHNTKVSSCLNIMCALAMREVYLKYGNQNERLRPILYGNVMSIRQLVKNKLMGPSFYDNLGYFVINLLNRFSETLSYQQLSHETFWKLVEADFDFLKQNIQDEIIYKIPQFEYEMRSDPSLFNDLWITNLGKMPNSYFKNQSMHRIESTLLGGSFNVENYLLYNHFLTLNDTLVQTIFYNKNCTSIISSYISSFNLIYKKYLI
jgi:hypothetical protein